MIPPCWNGFVTSASARQSRRDLTERLRKLVWNDSQELDVVLNRAEWDLNKLSSRIQKRETDRLKEDADRLDIVIPDDVRHVRTPMGDILSAQIRADLRRRIDEETTRRREVHAWWWKTIILPAMTALIGVLGALTGLVALVRKH